MSAKRAYVSFDYDHDEVAKARLAGQAQLPDSPLELKEASVKDSPNGDWKEKIRRRMDDIDVVIVLCGENTHNATTVADELAIAREKGKSYFLMAAYYDKDCTKPASAKPSDKVYQWTWDNLQALTEGAR